MTSEIERIAAEVERLERPSREVDAAIARSIGFGRVAQEWYYEKLEWYAWEAKERTGPWEVLKPYTASLDAATTLVPKGWKLRQMNFSAPCADDRKWHLNLHGGREGENTFVGRGATPALALCAAALKARAHLEQHHAKD